MGTAMKASAFALLTSLCLVTLLVGCTTTDTGSKPTSTGTTPAGQDAVALFIDASDGGRQPADTRAGKVTLKRSPSGSASSGKQKVTLLIDSKGNITRLEKPSPRSTLKWTPSKSTAPKASSPKQSDSAGGLLRGISQTTSLVEQAKKLPVPTTGRKSIEVLNDGMIIASEAVSLGKPNVKDLPSAMLAFLCSQYQEDMEYLVKRTELEIERRPKARKPHKLLEFGTLGGNIPVTMAAPSWNTIATPERKVTCSIMNAAYLLDRANAKIEATFEVSVKGDKVDLSSVPEAERFNLLDKEMRKVIEKLASSIAARLEEL